MIRSYFLREYRLTMQTGHLLCSVSAFLCETRDFQSDINNNLNCHFYERINKNFLFPSLLHIRDCNDAMRCSNFCRLKYFSAHEPQPEKAADVSRRHCWFPREMSSKKRAQKFHTMTRHYPDLGSASDWLKQISHGTTNQKQYQDLGSAASSVWNFCARFSAVISGGNQWWRCEMKAVFFRLRSQGDPVFSPRCWSM